MSFETETEIPCLTDLMQIKQTTEAKLAFIFDRLLSSNDNPILLADAFSKYSHQIKSINKQLDDIYGVNLEVHNRNMSQELIQLCMEIGVE
jgi:hypothetical protein